LTTSTARATPPGPLQADERDIAHAFTEILMPTSLDHSARDLLLILFGSALFAASGVMLGRTPLIAALWQRFKAALWQHPSITRISRIVGLAALPIAGAALVISSPLPPTAGDLSALLSASLFAVGVLGLVIGQAGESHLARRVATDTTDTIGPSSDTIETFNATRAAPPSNSRAA